MRYLSVCSGIEAATQAWAPLGWQCAGVSEIDKFPRAVLQEGYGAVPVEFDDHRHMPGSNTLPLFGDFTKIEEHHVGPIDLLVGGTPCQSFSVAGKRLGLDDPRGNLTLEFLALARRLRPRWLVWENVPGILSHDGGRTFGTFLGFLAECGFERWAYRVLDAQYVRVDRFGRAVPQRRRRVFVVGYSGTGDIHPRAVLFDRESLRGNPAPRREAGEGVAPTISARTKGGGGLGTDFDCDGGLIADGNWPADVAPTLNAAFGEKQGLEDQHIRGGQDYSCPDAANTLTRRMHKGINTTCDEGQTLIPTRGGGFDDAQQPYSIMPMNSGKDYKARETDVAQPIMAGGPHETANIRAASGGSSRSYVAEKWAVRRLTPRECERLMGFPDDFTKIPWRGKPADQCPDGPRYKALGNSMAVNVMCWIGERIATVEAIATPTRSNGCE